MMMKPIAIGLVFGLAMAARAQEGDLDSGGSPRPMNAGVSVELRSETVRLRIGHESVRADCRFELVNRGPACDVRVGFPDDSAERIAGGFETGLPPSHFERFRLLVDQKEVPTRLEKGSVASDANTIYRTTVVHFAARGQRGSTRVLRQIYQVAIGGETQFKSQLASYTLHTGALWRGPIGRSEISATFERAPISMRAVSLEALQARSKTDLFEDFSGASELARRLKKPGQVVYSGPGRAVVRANTVRWVRTRWNPTAKDDLCFWFKMP